MAVALATLWTTPTSTRWTRHQCRNPATGQATAPAQATSRARSTSPQVPPWRVSAGAGGTAATLGTNDGTTISGAGTILLNSTHQDLYHNFTADRGDVRISARHDRIHRQHRDQRRQPAHGEHRQRHSATPPASPSTTAVVCYRLRRVELRRSHHRIRNWMEGNHRLARRHPPAMAGPP